MNAVMHALAGIIDAAVFMYCHMPLYQRCATANENRDVQTVESSQCVFRNVTRLTQAKKSAQIFAISSSDPGIERTTPSI